MSMMDLDMSNGNPVPAGTPAQTSPPGQPTAPPDFLSLLAMQQGTSLPKLSPANEQDMKMLGPLALMQFAAQVAQPRAYGQSTMGAVANAVAGSAASYMDNKKKLEDQALQQDLARRKMAESEANIRQANVATAAATQRGLQEQQKFPMEMQNLRLAAQKAQSDNELAAINVRLGKVRERYADQLAQAELEEKGAKTASEKARAIEQGAQATYLLKHAELLKQEIDAKTARAGQAQYQRLDSIPGEPVQVFDKNNPARTYRLPMEDKAAALKYAERQVDAQVKAGDFKSGSPEAKKALNTIYNDLLRGNVPQPGSADPGMAPQGQPTPDKGPTPEDANNLAQAKKLGTPQLDPTTGKVYLPEGKIISKQEYDQLKGQRATAQGMPGAAPDTSGYKPIPGSLAERTVAGRQANKQAELSNARRVQGENDQRLTEASRAADAAIAAKDWKLAQRAQSQPGFSDLPDETKAKIFYLSNPRNH